MSSKIYLSDQTSVPQQRPNSAKVFKEVVFKRDEQMETNKPVASSSNFDNIKQVRVRNILKDIDDICLTAENRQKHTDCDTPAPTMSNDDYCHVNTGRDTPSPEMSSDDDGELAMGNDIPAASGPAINKTKLQWPMNYGGKHLNKPNFPSVAEMDPDETLFYNYGADKKNEDSMDWLFTRFKGGGQSFLRHQSEMDIHLPGPSAIDKSLPGPSAMDKNLPGLPAVDKTLSGPSGMDKTLPGPSAVDKTLPGPSAETNDDREVAWITRNVPDGENLYMASTESALSAASRSTATPGMIDLMEHYPMNDEEGQENQDEYDA